MLLYVKKLSFGYPSQAIFNSLSWETEAQITILEGPSGCGKTTFLRILAGQLKAGPFETSVPAATRLVLQDDGLFPWLTAAANLELSPAWPGFSALDESVLPIADAVSTYASQIVGTLSYGQRRLTELLRVLTRPTQVVFLDEPLNFLDGFRRDLVIAAIERLASVGHKFVISSHYEADFRRSAGTIRYEFSGNLPYHSLSAVVG